MRTAHAKNLVKHANDSRSAHVVWEKSQEIICWMWKCERKIPESIGAEKSYKTRWTIVKIVSILVDLRLSRNKWKIAPRKFGKFFCLWKSFKVLKPAFSCGILWKREIIEKCFFHKVHFIWYDWEVGENYSLRSRKPDKSVEKEKLVKKVPKKKDLKHFCASKSLFEDFCGKSNQRGKLLQTSSFDQVRKENFPKHNPNSIKQKLWALWKVIDLR